MLLYAGNEAAQRQAGPEPVRQWVLGFRASESRESGVGNRNELQSSFRQEFRFLIQSRESGVGNNRESGISSESGIESRESVRLLLRWCSYLEGWEGGLILELVACFQDEGCVLVGRWTQSKADE